MFMCQYLNWGCLKRHGPSSAKNKPPPCWPRALAEWTFHWVTEVAVRRLFGKPEKEKKNEALLL